MMSPRLFPLLLLALLALATPAVAKSAPAKQPPAAAAKKEAPQPQGPKPEKENFDSWTLLCQTPAEQKKVCILLQELQTKDDKGAAGRLARVTFLRKPNDPKVLLLDALLPLGIDLPAGAALAIDDKQQQGGMAFARCTNDGCETQLAVSDALLADMKKGATLKIGFNAGGKTLVVPVPLKGLAAGLNKMP